MSFLIQGVSALDEEPCQYGTSKLFCRGPKRDAEGEYLAFLGDSETYGRFVEWPFPALVEQATGQVCLNLGAVNVGLDSYLHDPDLIALARAADAAVVQVMGAQNLTNRFYKVHPRRNDRFLAPTAELRAIFPEVDFTEINFNRHLLNALHRVSPERFKVVAQELKALWVARMQRLVEKIDQRALLLWLHLSEPVIEDGAPEVPDLVDSQMVEALRPCLGGVVDVNIRTAGTAGELNDMVFGQMQIPVAEHSVGPAAHALIANAVVEALPTPT